MFYYPEETVDSHIRDCGETVQTKAWGPWQCLAGMLLHLAEVALKFLQ